MEIKFVQMCPLFRRPQKPHVNMSDCSNSNRRAMNETLLIRVMWNRLGSVTAPCDQMHKEQISEKSAKKFIQKIIERPFLNTNLSPRVCSCFSRITATEMNDILVPVSVESVRNVSTWQGEKFKKVLVSFLPVINPDMWLDVDDNDEKVSGVQSRDASLWLDVTNCEDRNWSNQIWQSR